MYVIKKLFDYYDDINYYKFTITSDIKRKQ